MNTTFKEVIYNIKNLRQAGRQSQDTLLQDSQYAFIIDYYRSILVDRDYRDRKDLSPVFEQTILVPLTRVRDMEGDVFGDKRVYKATIPSVVSSARPLYTAVRTDMFSPSIERSTTRTIRHDVNSPNTGHIKRYFPEGKDIYVLTPDPLQKVFITAIFEHPLEVEKYKANNGQQNSFNPFDPYNFEYPMSLRMMDSLYKMMTDGEIKFSLLTMNDTSTDGNEEPSKPLPVTKDTKKTSSDES